MTLRLASHSQRFHAMLPKIKYPKLLLLLLTFIVAYFLLEGRELEPLRALLSTTGYFGTFLAGVGLAYGFTAMPATVILLLLAQEQNLVVAGLIAGMGSLLGDLVIFQFIRSSLEDEMIQLSKSSFMVHLRHFLHLEKFSEHFKHYLVIVFSGFIIALPFLPDEIGVSLLASAAHVSPRMFVIISYLLNTAGILLILMVGLTIDQEIQAFLPHIK